MKKRPVLGSVQPDRSPNKLSTDGPLVLIAVRNNIARRDAENHSFDQALTARTNLADALIKKGKFYGNSDQALKCFDDVVERFSNAPELQLRLKAIEALNEKAAAYRIYLNDDESSIETLNEITTLYSGAEEIELRLEAALALATKAWTYARLDRANEAIAIYDCAIETLEEEVSLDSRCILAAILLNKADTLKSHGHTALAKDAYSEVFAPRFSALMHLSDDISRTISAAFVKYCKLTSDDDESQTIEETDFSTIAGHSFFQIATHAGVPEEYILKYEGDFSAWLNTRLPSGRTIKDTVRGGREERTRDLGMSHETDRDALEHKLDLLREEYENRFGLEAAKMAFARRASAGSESTQQLGMSSVASSGDADPLNELIDSLKLALASATLEERTRIAGLALPDQKDIFDAIAAAKLEFTSRRVDFSKPPLPKLSSEDIKAIKQRAKDVPWANRGDDRRTSFEWVRDNYREWVGRGLLQAHLKADLELYAAFSKYAKRVGLPEWLDVPTEGDAFLRRLVEPGEQVKALLARNVQAAIVRVMKSRPLQR